MAPQFCLVQDYVDMAFGTSFSLVQVLLGGVKIGMCTPSSCSDDDVLEILANTTDSNGDSAGMSSQFNILDCHSEDKRPEVTAGDIIFG